MKALDCAACDDLRLMARALRFAASVDEFFLHDDSSERPITEEEQTRMLQLADRVDDAITFTEAFIR